MEYKRPSYCCNRAFCTSNKRDDKLSGCPQCKTARYCSEECQKKDWIIHKEHCHQELRGRIAGCVKQMIKYRSKLRCHNHLSIYPLFKIDGEYYNITPYPNMTLRDNHCPICGNLIDYDVELRDVQIRFVIQGSTVEYYRCDACFEQKRELCTTHYIAKDLCRPESILSLIHI